MKVSKKSYVGCMCVVFATPALTSAADTNRLTETVKGRAPVATTVTVSGTTSVGQTLSGSYVYSDLDNDPQDVSGTTLQWYRNDVAITGANEGTYLLSQSDQTATIKFGVTPKSTSGDPDIGVEELSAATAAIFGTGRLQELSATRLLN